MTVAILKNVRLSFPDIWKPGKPMNEGDTPKYGGQFIFAEDSEAMTAAKAAFSATANETFGANAKAILGAMEKSKKCLRRGDENLTKDGVIRDGYAGNMYVVARNKAKPLIIGPTRIAAKGTNTTMPDGRQVVDGFPVLTEADGKPYGGCTVHVKVDIKGMKAKEKMPNQVYATLLTIQFVADGEAFGAAPGTSEGFDEVEGAEAIGGGGGSDANDLF